MVNYVKVTNFLFQNNIFPELNSKKHTQSPTIWFLRNCGIEQNSSCGIAQNLSFAKAEKGKSGIYLAGCSSNPTSDMVSKCLDLESVIALMCTFKQRKNCILIYPHVK